MNQLYDFAPQEKFDAIILAGRWDISEIKKLENAISFLKQYTPRIILLGPIIEYQTELPRVLAREGASAESAKNVAKHNSWEKTRPVDEKMRQVAAKTGVEYYSVLDSLCTKEGCTTMTANGVPVQFDYGHLTQDGARLVMERLRDQQGLQLR